MLKIFEFTKALFEQPGVWANISKADKSRNFFMTSRFMGIAFPLQAQALNHQKINMPETMNFWQRFMRSRYKKTPFWMFIKGSVKAKQAKEATAKVSDKSIENFATAHGLEIKSVKDSLIFFPKETIKEINTWEKIAGKK